MMDEMKEGAILRKHEAANILEGLKAELAEVRRERPRYERLGGAALAASERYEFILESIIALAETMQETKKRIDAIDEKLIK